MEAIFLFVTGINQPQDNIFWTAFIESNFYELFKYYL